MSEQHFELCVAVDDQQVERHLLVCENESADNSQAIVRSHVRLDIDHTDDVLPLREYVEECRQENYWCRLYDLMEKLRQWSVTCREVTIS